MVLAIISIALGAVCVTGAILGGFALLARRIQPPAVQTPVVPADLIRRMADLEARFMGLEALVIRRHESIKGMLGKLGGRPRNDEDEDDEEIVIPEVEKWEKLAALASAQPGNGAQSGTPTGRPVWRRKP